jgi:epoxyqueuosine reductase QueG
VPAAIDAGLGELSRAGNLITKEFGTRIRLGAITTDADLIADAPADIGATEFCEACGKCARQCPLGAIPRGGREVVNGSLRWAVHPEKCYEYWTRSGTHCSLCLSCCPWSHDTTFTHNVLKMLAQRFHRLHPLMVWADDVCYGKKINSRLGPGWIDFRHQPDEPIALESETRDR